jgi:nitrite reductase/ring-hydroxylating ferredoxin subunit
MKRLYFIVFLVLAGLSCGKNSDPIPNVAVDFNDSLSDPRLSALNAAGGVVLISGYGVAGLIIYREPDGSYAAYDRCSSYKPENKCAVNLDPSHLTVTDPCSGSIFSLLDGTPVKGPATQSLKPYSVSTDGVNIFVSN